MNRPDILVMNHLDYVDGAAAACGKPTDRVLEFVEDVEQRIGQRIDLLGFSPASLAPRVGASASSWQ